MVYVASLLFAWLLANFGATEAIPYPTGEALTPRWASVQFGRDDVSACHVPEMRRRLSETSILHEPSSLASRFSWIGFLSIVIVVLVLLVIAEACYRTISSDSPYREEPESLSSRSPLLGHSRASSTTLYNQYQSTSATGTLAYQSLLSLALTNNYSLTASPTHSRSTTIDDQTHITHHLGKPLNETQPEFHDGGFVQSVSRIQLESGRRAETAPNSILRSASRQLTQFWSWIGCASTQPIRHTDVRILGVGLNWDHIEDRALPGPVHDILWLKNLLDHHQEIRFSYLLNDAATYEGIHQQLEETYKASTTESYLILYFAGHGTADNSLELYDCSKSINASAMTAWIAELRQTTRKHIPVYIIFDFCRASSAQPNTNLAKDVHIIWACSPLQSALDLDLGSEGEYDLPRSCFLMALALAVHDASTIPALPAWKQLAARLKELVNVARGGEYWGSKDTLPWPRCRCNVCLDGAPCADTGSSEEQCLSQVVCLSTLEANLDFSAVARFVASRFPLYIRRVAHLVSNNYWVMFFNPVRTTANRGSLQPRRPEFLRNNICVCTRITARHMTVPTEGSSGV